MAINAREARGIQERKLIPRFAIIEVFRDHNIALGDCRSQSLQLPCPESTPAKAMNAMQ
jgi:hypothetical protein